MIEAYMRDKTHGQGFSYGKYRALEKTHDFGTMACMKQIVNIQDIRERIEVEMKAKGFSSRKLALTAGLAQTAIRDVMQRIDNPTIGTLVKIAEALDMSFDHLTSGAHVPLVGQIGAGGEIALFNEAAENFEMVLRPPLLLGPVMALEVQGDSMLPKYDPGDIIYVTRAHDGVLPQYMGRHCAVHLDDGGTYLKILSAGTVAGKYTLRSLNAADMENVEVIWASPVLFTMPRSARLQADRH